MYDTDIPPVKVMVGTYSHRDYGRRILHLDVERCSIICVRVRVREKYQEGVPTNGIRLLV